MSRRHFDKLTDALVEKAIDWKRETTDVRCNACGARVGRRPAEMALYEAVAACEDAALLGARTAFASEAPTTTRSKRKNRNHE